MFPTGENKVLTTQEKIREQMEQLFDTIFVVGDKKFAEIHSFDPNCGMLKHNLLEEFGADIGWRFRVILQVMYKRTTPDMREYAGEVFDNIVHNYVLSGQGQGLTLAVMVALSKEPAGR
jgi:hypothetical protein